MAATAVKHDPTPLEPPAPKKSTYAKRQRPPPPLPPPKLKPRSAGFVFRSKRSNTADFSEFADVHQTDKLIRRFFDESRQERLKDEPEAIQNRHQHFRRHIKKMLHIHPSSLQEVAKGSTTISSTSMVAQQTPEGRKYGQIVTGHPYDVPLNVSTFNVNKMRRTASAATQGTQMRKIPVKDAEMNPAFDLPLERRGNGSHESKEEHVAQEVSDDPRSTSVELQEPASKVSVHMIFHSKQRKGMVRPAQITTDVSKPYVGAPVIPSPRKSVFHRNLGLASNWAESFSASQESGAKYSPSHISYCKADNEPVGRDFATSGVNLLQRLRDDPSSSCSPGKKAEPQDAVAGLSHNYSASDFPNLRQRIKDLPASNSQNKNQRSTAPLREIQEPPPAHPSSPTANFLGDRPMLKPSPIIQHHTKAPSIVSAESAAEDVQSDASSGVVSNAQSAVLMRGQIATDHHRAAHTRKLPMPGPPPTGALPSLPEGHDSVAPTTRRFSGSNQRVNSPGKSPGTIAVPTKSPKRPEYRFIPSDCSPPKVKQPASPEQFKETLPEQLTPPSSTQIRIKRQGLAFPRPDQLPKGVSAGDMDRWQQQQNEKTKACKVQDLTRLGSPKATIENVNAAVSARNSCEEHGVGIAVQPSIEDLCSSSLLSGRHRLHASQNPDSSLSTTMQNGKSSALSKNRESSTPSQRLSPIMVVAEQEPISPVLRLPSQDGRASTRNSMIDEAPNSRFSRDSTEGPPRAFPTSGFHSGPWNPASPSLQLPEDEVKSRPLSTHSMTASRALASRTPTPFTHSLLRAQSNRSSHETSMHVVQVSELETRLVAIEKKNVMLERAFLAVINTPAAYGGFGGGGEPSLVHGDGERLSNGGFSNGNGGSGGERSSGGSATESLYVGLENLLALHASEVGKRLSTSSGPP